MSNKKEIKNNPLGGGKPVDAFSRFSNMATPATEATPTPTRTPASETEHESVISNVASEARQKRTMATTHTRATFIVENELLDRWNALLATQSEKRIKNKVFNRMLREFLDKEEASMNEN